MLISVIIPTYNRSELLLRTLNSVLQQERPADEIIVVDDGSTDDTRSVVADLNPTASKIRYVYQENAYLGAARNNGTHHSIGDFLLFLDSDDLLAPTALSRLEEALLRNENASLAYSDYENIGLQDERTPELEAHPPPQEGDVWTKLVDANFIRSAGCALIRRDALRKVGKWDVALRGLEDYDMWLRLAEVGHFVHVPAPLFKYRIHGSNMSSNGPQMEWFNWMLYRKHAARRTYRSEKRQYIQRRMDSFALTFIRPQVFTWVNEAADLYRKRQFRSAIQLMKKAYIGYPVGVVCYMARAMRILHAIESRARREDTPALAKAVDKQIE